jgi:parvulin-like peptidyl-prolyl isomerase
MMYFLPEPKADYIQRMAQQWLDIQLLYDAAQKRGVTNDPKTKMMADLGYKQAFAREVMNKVANDVNIGDAQVQEYYDKNKNTDPMLFDPNLYSFTHIVVKTPAEANAVVTRIRAGEDPTKLAKDLSTAPDGKNGGSVKKLPEQMLARQYNDAFAKAVMSSSEGQVFGPIEVRGSYEVVRNEGKLSSKVKPLDDKLKQQIKMTLERKEKGGATEKFLQTLRDEAKKEGKVKMAPIAESKEVKPQ